jgi:hypothetical protein
VTTEEITKLAADVQRWTDEGSADEQECVRCHEPVHTPSDLEPTAMCDRCAQIVVYDLIDAFGYVLKARAASEVRQ